MKNFRELVNYSSRKVVANVAPYAKFASLSFAHFFSFEMFARQYFIQQKKERIKRSR